MSDNHDVIISSDAIFCLPFYKFNSFKKFIQTTERANSVTLKTLRTMRFCFVWHLLQTYILQRYKNNPCGFFYAF